MTCLHPQKYRHATKDAARAAIASLDRSGRGSPDMSVYPCHGDDGTLHWHVGHDVRKFTKRIRSSIKAGQDRRSIYRRRK